MNAAPIMLGIASCLLLILTLPGTLYLSVLTVAGSLRRRPVTGLPLRGRIAIVVPAHDEAAVIARTLQNLGAVARSDGATDVVVVADNMGKQVKIVRTEDKAEMGYFF